MRRRINAEVQKNNLMILVILVMCACMIGVFVYNITHVATKEVVATGETLTLVKSDLKNDLYRIGNNPTDLQKEYFEELTVALKDDDPFEITSAVVKCFVADYFTWTNKDGNYEVGGLAYIYGPKFTIFQEKTRYEFYKDLDLYIAQYGRENLLQVKDITLTEAVYNGKYTIYGEEFESYYVEATWEYEKCPFDTSEFQHTGYFTVVDRDGRYEIVSIFDSWD